jgi:hypothetical protein
MSMPLITPVHFGTDQGPACDCGGTIYGYRVQPHPAGPRVDAQCYGCHAVDYFYPRNEPQSAAECSQQHRDAKAFAFGAYAHIAAPPPRPQSSED